LARVLYADETRNSPFHGVFPVRPLERLLFGGFTFEERWHLVLSDAGFDEGESDRVLFVNPLSIPDASLVEAIRKHGDRPRAWTLGGRTLAVLADGDRAAGGGEDPVLIDLRGDLPVSEGSGTIVENPWDLVAGNARRIREDGALLDACPRRPDLACFVFEPASGADLPDARVRGCAGVFLGKDAAIEPFVLLDASEGPIRVGERVVIEAHAVLRGPLWIRPDARIKSGSRIGPGTTIGEGSRVAGEVEETVFGAFSNKQHEGFLGHAYVGEWVNLGAGTNNSDLKNNYGTIRVDWGEGSVDTGLRKLGCFIGDHVKSAIGTRIGTGTVVGAASNLFGERGLVGGYVPPFTWGEGNALYDFERAVETMKRARERRREELERAGRPASMEGGELSRLRALWEGRKGRWS
jgi:UDP-N-acetylglucosamine diphosphorylase/glucosamine-1-phosphate N-acetyltransferase